MADNERLKRSIEELRLLDDEFFIVYFDGNIQGIEFVLNTIFNRNDLKVTDIQVQQEYHSISERSITIDVYCTDSSGTKYNVEVQRATKGALPKRARFHSSMLDTKLIKKGEYFDKLAETYVIFITETDVFHHGLPLYRFDRYCAETNEYLNDEAHIIYVNGAFKDMSTPIGRLMHDFKCTKAEDLYNEELKERFKYLKETEEGEQEMCEAVRKYVDEEVLENKKNNIKKILAVGKLTIEEIANSFDVSLEFVESIAAEMVKA